MLCLLLVLAAASLTEAAPSYGGIDCEHITHAVRDGLETMAKLLKKQHDLEEEMEELISSLIDAIPAQQYGPTSTTPSYEPTTLPPPPPYEPNTIPMYEPTTTASTTTTTTTTTITTTTASTTTTPYPSPPPYEATPLPGYEVTTTTTTTVSYPNRHLPGY